MSRVRRPIAAALLLAAAPAAWSAESAPAASSIVAPADSDARVRDRLKKITDDVRVIDKKLRTPGLAEQDFRTLQELRTSLEQERKLLEDQRKIYKQISTSPVLMHLVGGATAQAPAPTAKTIWEAGGWARFEGVLPCADCDGIQTELTLYNDGLKYVMEERYLGGNAPPRSFKSEGLWTTLRGHEKDPDATVFQLDYDKPGKERHFLRITDDEIRNVDLDPSKLKRAPNLTLKRVAP